MFLDRHFILANELVQKMNIHIANISMLRKEFEAGDDLFTITKLNNCNFVKSNSPKLPKNIQNAIKQHDFTDMSNKLPVTFVKQEYEMSESELKKSGIITGTLTVAGKKMFVFNRDFVENMRGCVGYVLNEKETSTCKSQKTIDGSIKLRSNKYFVWYKLHVGQ